MVFALPLAAAVGNLAVGCKPFLAAMVRKRAALLCATPPGLGNEEAASTCQLHQRLDDLSKYVQDLRSDIKESLKNELRRDLELDTNSSSRQPADLLIDDLSSRVERLELLLFRADFNQFAKVDEHIANMGTNSSLPEQPEAESSPQEQHEPHDNELDLIAPFRLEFDTAVSQADDCSKLAGQWVTSMDATCEVCDGVCVFDGGPQSYHLAKTDMNITLNEWRLERLQGDVAVWSLDKDFVYWHCAVTHWGRIEEARSVNSIVRVREQVHADDGKNGSVIQL